MVLCRKGRRSARRVTWGPTPIPLECLAASLVVPGSNPSNFWDSQIGDRIYVYTYRYIYFVLYSICLFICLFVYLFIGLFVYLFIGLFVCLFVYWFVCLFVFINMRIDIHRQPHFFKTSLWRSELPWKIQNKHPKLAGLYWKIL